MATLGWMIRLGRWYTRKPKLVGFSALVVLILVLAGASVATGFTHGFLPNLLLNAAGDMLGGMVILLMIEPIVSRAAVQIRQHPHLDFRLFAERIPLAEREILVLDTYSGLFDAVNGRRAVDQLRDAARRGVKVKILLMSPATDASRLRQAQLAAANPGLQIDALLHGNISLLSRLENELRGGGATFDMETDYAGLPSAGLFAGDPADTGEREAAERDTGEQLALITRALDENSLEEHVPEPGQGGIRGNGRAGRPGRRRARATSSSACTPWPRPSPSTPGTRRCCSRCCPRISRRMTRRSSRSAAARRPAGRSSRRSTSSGVRPAKCGTWLRSDCRTIRTPGRCSCATSS